MNCWGSDMMGSMFEMERVSLKEGVAMEMYFWIALLALYIDSETAVEWIQLNVHMHLVENYL